MNKYLLIKVVNETESIIKILEAEGDTEAADLVEQAYIPDTMTLKQAREVLSSFRVYPLYTCYKLVNLLSLVDVDQKNNRPSMVENLGGACLTEDEVDKLCSANELIFAEHTPLPTNSKGNIGEGLLR